MGLFEHAKRELDQILSGCKDSESIKMQKLINNDILGIVERFGNQGHSGFSASYVINLLTRLLSYKPLSTLTGEDDEWGEARNFGGKTVQQNIRCSAVFRENFDNSTAYSVDAVAWSDNGGITWFTRGGHNDPREHIVFPYAVPDKSIRVYLDESGEREISDEEAKELRARKQSEYDALRV